jgi:hypothetical protein
MDKKLIRTAALMVKRLTDSGLSLDNASCLVCGAYGMKDAEAVVKKEVVKLGVGKKDMVATARPWTGR